MHLQDAIDYIVTAKRASGRAERTLQDYRRVLGRYAEHVPADLDAWTRDHIRAYIADLRDDGLAPATVALHIRYLRAFWRWAFEEGLLAENFAEIIPAPGRHVRDDDVPTQQEFAAMIRACAETKYPLRNRAILMMLVDTGLRRGEIAAVRRDWITFEDGGAWFKLPGAHTKNGDARIVIMGATSARCLREYLDTRADDDPWLFHSDRHGQPLGSYGIYRVVTDAAEAAGVAGVYPHLLRAMFATFWIANGGDEKTLMELGGWRDRTMLLVYVRNANRRALQKSHQKHSPVEGFDLDLEE